MIHCPKCSAEMKAPAIFKSGDLKCSSCGAALFAKESDKSSVLLMLSLFAFSGAIALAWPWKVALVTFAFLLFLGSRRYVQLTDEAPQSRMTVRSTPEKALYLALFLLAVGIALLPAYKLLFR